MARRIRVLQGFLSLLLAVAMGTAVQAQVDENLMKGQKTGVIQWAVWIDQDGCMHWWADGGFEGYMVSRRDPKTGKPVCLKKDTCFIGDADTMFKTDSAHLNPHARQRLKQVFTQQDVFGYGVYGHTDSRASHAYNKGLSERRAKSVGDYGRSVGAIIERQIGFGETRPRASNATAAGMRKNRRVEIVCYRW